MRQTIKSDSTFKKTQQEAKLLKKTIPRLRGRNAFP